MTNLSDTLSAIELLQSKSLPMLVQDEIVRMLHNGELAAGTKLSEAALAARFGVSRGPVREAFRALEEAGLVRVEKNRGVFVREVSATEASEMYDVRAGLDELAARLLAPLIADAQLAELRRMIAAMDEVAVNGVDAYFPLNLRFHDRIVEMTGNRTLLGVYRRLINEMHLLRRHGLVFGGGLAVSNDEHRGIVEALARRDAEAAARTVRGHVLAGRARLETALAATTLRNE
jgi:phosphonate utilization transcriptional regulator